MKYFDIENSFFGTVVNYCIDRIIPFASFAIKIFYQYINKLHRYFKIIIIV